MEELAALPLVPRSLFNDVYHGVWVWILKKISVRRFRNFVSSFAATRKCGLLKCKAESEQEFVSHCISLFICNSWEISSSDGFCSPLKLKMNNTEAEELKHS